MVEEEGKEESKGKKVNVRDAYMHIYPHPLSLSLSFLLSSVRGENHQKRKKMTYKLYED